MKNNEKVIWTHTAIRVIIGLMFILAGWSKLSGLLAGSGPTGMLEGIAVFAWAPLFFAWVLTLTELVFGIFVFTGYKVKYTTWPLAFVLFVAWLTVVIGSSGIFSNNSLFHLIAIFALGMLAFSGPGKYAISKD